MRYEEEEEESQIMPQPAADAKGLAVGAAEPASAEEWIVEKILGMRTVKRKKEARKYNWI